MTTVMAAVTGIEPGLDVMVIEGVVRTAAGSSRGLRQLADHLTAHPDVLTTGPTTVPVVLRQLVAGLVGVGAEQIVARAPRCLGCGRAEAARHRAPEGDGWLCGRCYQVPRQPCGRCGTLRPVYTRDPDAAPVCEVCTRHARRQAADAGLTAGIVTTVLDTLGAGDAAAVRLSAQELTCLVGRAAPRPCDRARLAVDLPAVLAGVTGTSTVVDPVAGMGHRAGWSLPTRRLVIALTGLGFAGMPVMFCDQCQAPVGGHGHAAAGGDLCLQCATTCPDCGRVARQPGAARCGRCGHDRARDLHRVTTRGDCPGCGRTDKILDAGGVCAICQARRGRRCADCQQEPGGPLRSVQGRRVCDPCRLRCHLDALLPHTPVPDTVQNTVRRFREAILAGDPRATLQWLSRPVVRQILTALHADPASVNHAMLDALPASRSRDHVRDLLVTVGILPADPHRSVDRVGRELDGMLQAVPETDRRITRAWLRWAVLVRLRRRVAAGQELPAAVYHARATTTQVVAFLTWLHERGVGLGTCRQVDLDGWFATGPDTRYHVRTFLSWADQHRHLPRGLHLPPDRRAAPRQPADPEHRWVIARRLIHDDDLDPADRVAGALVVLYAQPLARIVALTTGHVHIEHVRVENDVVTLALGPAHIELPEPFAGLIQTLPRHRHGGPPAHLPTEWLFPSVRAGKHTTPQALANRLRVLGIAAGRQRQAALLQLAGEVPPSMLADLLGIHVTTAVHWNRTSAGNWATYAAARGPHR